MQRDVRTICEGVAHEAGEAACSDLYEGSDSVGVHAFDQLAESYRLHEVVDEELS